MACGLAVVLLVACTGGDDGADGPRVSTSTAAGPRGSGPGSSLPVDRAPSGEVRLAVAEEVVTLDPFDARSRAVGSASVLTALLPQLFRVTPDGRARGWLVDDDGIEEAPGSVSFRLRPGARWSDGNPVTLRDLEFTLEVVRGPAWPGPAVGYEAVTGIEAVGDRIRITFDPARLSPVAWRRLFSGADFVLPAHRLEGSDLKVVWKAGPDVTAGPFRLTGFTPGLEAVLEATPGWWGGGPGVSRVRVLAVPDPVTMEQLLERGELDVAWVPATPNRTSRLDAISGVAVSKGAPGGWIVSLVANTERLPAERRRALLGLVKRDRFVDVLLAGEASLATSVNRVGGSGPWGRGAVAPGGGKVGGDVSLSFAEEEGVASLLARALEPAVRSAGSQLELIRSDAALVEGTWSRQGRFDLLLIDQFDWPVPCFGCSYSGAAIGEGNVSRISALDDLVAAADRGDAGAADVLEARLAEDAVLLPLWRPSSLLAFRGVEGVVANSWSPTPLWGAEDWRMVR
ncbi:MAG: ABC transporter substrate-binding protein [Acidimicrobiia bacterium]